MYPWDSTGQSKEVEIAKKMLFFFSGGGGGGGEWDDRQNRTGIVFFNTK